jgi:hypothetical protein
MYVNEALAILGEKINSMEKLKDDFSDGSINRIHGFGYYVTIIKESQMLVDILKRNTQYVSEEYKKNLADALRYTLLVQKDLREEITKSPVVFWHIYDIRAETTVMDDIIFLYISHLEYIQQYTEKIIKLHNSDIYSKKHRDTMSILMHRSIAHVQLWTNIWIKNIQTLCGEEWLISRANIQYIHHLTHGVLDSFVDCAKIYIDCVQEKLAEYIDSIFCMHRDNHDATTLSYHKITCLLLECLHDMILDIAEKLGLDILVARIDSLYQAHRHYTDKQLTLYHSSTYGQHSWSKNLRII